MMLVERDNTLADNTLMTVKEFLEKVEADFDRIVIQNNDGLILYYGDRSAGIPEKLKNACADHADLSEDHEFVITLAR